MGLLVLDEIPKCSTVRNDNFRCVLPMYRDLHPEQLNSYTTLGIKGVEILSLKGKYDFIVCGFTKINLAFIPG